MPDYYLLLDAGYFHGQAQPALAESWRRRSFAPCRDLCLGLLPRARQFSERYWIADQETLLERAAAGLPFDRSIWRLLAGEVLLYAAADLPEIQTAPETLLLLLEPARYAQGPVARDCDSPIEQAHYGARDLRFGPAFYRPEHAGTNNASDVVRLAGYLSAVETNRWTPADLTALRGAPTAADRIEELEWARDCFSALRELYTEAARREQVVIVEAL